jgi:hypothetical protein
MMLGFDRLEKWQGHSGASCVVQPSIAQAGLGAGVLMSLSLERG